jgi:hypothetical protein
MEKHRDPAEDKHTNVMLLTGVQMCASSLRCIINEQESNQLGPIVYSFMQEDTFTK